MGNPPDFIVKVEDPASDDPEGLTKIGAAWRWRDGEGINIRWDKDNDRTRQLLYECDRAILFPRSDRSSSGTRAPKSLKQAKLKP